MILLALPRHRVSAVLQATLLGTQSGRAERIRDLLVHSGLMSPEACASQTISTVLQRLLQQCPALFMTLAQGMRRGTIVFLRCAACKTVSAGNWRWSHVPEKSQFPDGFHRPVYVPSSEAGRRWFFATPQVCWETSLLQWLLTSMARGGMTSTALFYVYMFLWTSSVQGGAGVALGVQGDRS